MTNFQMIKNMSVEEMAEFMDDMSANCLSGDCVTCPIGKYHAVKVSDYAGEPCDPKIIQEWLKSDGDCNKVIEYLTKIIDTIRDSESIKHKDTILPMLRDVVLRMTKHQYEGDI